MVWRRVRQDQPEKLTQRKRTLIERLTEIRNNLQHFATQFDAQSYTPSDCHHAAASIMYDEVTALDDLIAALKN